MRTRSSQHPPRAGPAGRVRVLGCLCPSVVIVSSSSCLSPSVAVREALMLSIRSSVPDRFRIARASLCLRLCLSRSPSTCVHARLRSSSCAPPPALHLHARARAGRQALYEMSPTENDNSRASERASWEDAERLRVQCVLSSVCMREREREREGERASAMECIECPEWKLPLRSFLLVLLYHTVMIYNVNKRTNKRDRCLQTNRGTDRQTEREGERYIFILFVSA